MKLTETVSCRRPMLALASAAALTLLIVSAARAQTAMWHFEGGVAGDPVPMDFNGDGCDDIFVPGGSTDVILSGCDGSVLRRLPRRGLSPLDDANGDGAIDFVQWERGIGWRCFSGKDGKSVLWVRRSQPGERLSAAAVLGDIDRDGVLDLGSLISGWTTGVPDRIGVLSGKTGREIWRHDSSWGCVTDAGDVDGDGVPEVAVSNSRLGRVGIFSIRKNKLLRVIDRGPNSGFSVMVRARDFDGDKVPDLLVSAPRAAYVEVLSGKTGLVLQHIQGSRSDYFGWGALALLNDMNGDGILEILVGAPYAPYRYTEGQGEAYILSGKDAKLLWKMTRITSERFGQDGAYIGDVNGDGVDDFTVGGRGLSRVVSTKKLAMHHTQHLLCPRRVGRFELDAGAKHAGQAYLILGSLSGQAPGLDLGGGMHLPLNVDSYMRFLFGSPNAFISPQAGVLDARGRAQTNPVRIGSRVSFQLDDRVLSHAYVLFGPGGKIDFVSNVAALRICAN